MFSGLVLFGLFVGMMVGFIGACARAVIRICISGGNKTDFWNIVEK